MKTINLSYLSERFDNVFKFKINKIVLGKNIDVSSRVEVFYDLYKPVNFIYVSTDVFNDIFQDKVDKIKLRRDELLIIKTLRKEIIIMSYAKNFERIFDVEDYDRYYHIKIPDIYVLLLKDFIEITI